VFGLGKNHTGGPFSGWFLTHLPATVPTVRTWPLVGRVGELEGIAAALTDPAVRAVVVTGPAGIGKTRLLDEVARRADSSGHAVTLVRATASAASMPLAAVQALLPNEGGHASHRELLAAAVSALRRRQERGVGRLLVAVDDAHLLDDASATLVHALCAGGGPLVVATVRAGERAPDAVAALWKDFDADRVELGPLSDVEVAALLARALGGPVEGRSAHRVTAISGGNPLLVREVVRAAQRSGGLVRDVDGLWRLAESLPRSLRLAEIVEEQVGGLGRRARSAVDALALVGPLELDLLVRYAGRDAAAEAEAAGLVRVLTDGRRRVVELSHPLYAEVLSAGQPRLRAQDVHARLAEILSATGLRRRGDLARLARWQLAAGLLPDRPALVDAAVTAHEQGDHPLTLELAALAEAHDDHPDPQAEYRLASACAGSALWLGRTADSDRYFGRAVAAAPPAARGALLLGRAFNLFLGAGRVSAAERVLAEASRAGAPPSPVAALRALFLASAGRIADALAACDAVAADERSVAAVRVSALTWCGRSGDAVAAATAAERLVPVDGAPEQVLDAITCTALAVSEGLGSVEARARRSYTEALSRPDLGARAMWAFALGHLLLWWGRPSAAAPLLTEAATTMAERPTGLGPASHMHCLGNLAEARALLGDLVGADRALAEVELVPVGDCTSTALETGRAWTLAARGERDRARALLRDTADGAERFGNRLAAGRALLDLARLGDSAAAAELAHTGSRLQGRLPRLWVTYAAGLLDGEVATAVPALERAGHCLLAGEAAVAAASDAGRVGGPVAAARWAAHGRRLLDREGVVAPWLDTPPGLPPLTRREMEIARLVADGRSSREVAADLHLSVRTVDSHLGHVYRKLGVHTRAELAAALGDIDGGPVDSGATPSSRRS
jgi:DNA-binding CsgD family transcriptional regulator